MELFKSIFASSEDEESSSEEDDDDIDNEKNNFLAANSAPESPSEYYTSRAFCFKPSL